MSKDTEYVATLIEFTVSEDNERVDLEACLEVADRANTTKAECLEAIRTITKSLGKSNVKIVLNTLQLLETMCKNCNMRFLYELNNKKLVDALLKFVQRRRDRTKYGAKAPKSSNPLKTDAEDKILYLIQLWADTFMMHQAEFRNIHDAYRALRKDGVQFPEREANQKFMINFQGQTSPVFLAMENNVPIPSGNQGGPVTDLKKNTNQYKPKPTEYKHEYASSSRVQNTLYDENDEDYDYSAYDGIQITPDEIRILEESVGILREIERNATKPADMKDDIAKEILSDLVHVHKRLKRFLKSEKFAGPSQKNEAIKLNQLLSSCLSSYKTKYYKLKEDQQRRVQTEPDDYRRGRFNTDQDDEAEQPRNLGKNAGRLQTEYDDSYNNHRIRANDLASEVNKLPVKKANFSNHKLAPPSGWQVPNQVQNQGLGSNPDLIDLLNNRDTQKPKTAQKPVEEKKEDTKKKNGAQPDLLTDLLDLNFTPSTNNQTKQTSSVMATLPDQTNSKDLLSTLEFDPWAPATNEKNVTPQKNSNASQKLNTIGDFDFSKFENPIDNASSKIIGNTISTPKLNSPFAFTQPQLVSPTNPIKTKPSTKAPVAAVEDDDDFFSDIANRKK